MNLKRTFTLLVLLYCISLSLLIPASLLPKPVLTGNLLLLCILYIRLDSFKLKTYFSWRRQYFILLVIYVVFYIFMRFFDFMSNPQGGLTLLSGLNLTVLALLFLLVMMSLTSYEINYLIKYYVIFAVIFSLFGLIAWSLVTFDYIRDGEFLFNLFEASNGKYGRDKFEVEGGYTAPYYFGLVLTTSYEYNTMGFSHYRASGWAHEPTTATLFVVPAMIILFTQKQMFGRKSQYVFFIIIIGFWLVCSAVGSFLSVIILIFVAVIFYFLRRGLTRKGLTLLSITFAVALIITPDITEIIETSTLIQNKFGDDQNPAIELLNEILLLGSFENDLDFVLNIFLRAFLIFNVVISIVGILKGNSPAVFGYVCLYIMIHGAKGSWTHVLSYIFTLFFFYVLLFFCDREQLRLKTKSIYS